MVPERNLTIKVGASEPIASTAAKTLALVSPAPATALVSEIIPPLKVVAVSVEMSLR